MTAGGRTHRVSIDAPSHNTDEPEVRRFMEVWDEVLRAVPSPDEEQTPGLDRDRD